MKKGKIEIIVPDAEIEIILSEHLDYKNVFRNKGGVYMFYHNEEMVYCGITSDLRNRLSAHSSSNNGYVLSDFEKYKMIYKNEIICKIFYEEDICNREIYEAWIIRENKPRFNFAKTEKSFNKGTSELTNENIIEAILNTSDNVTKRLFVKTENIIPSNIAVVGKLYCLNQMGQGALSKHLNIKLSLLKKHWDYFREAVINNNIVQVVENQHIIFGNGAEVKGNVFVLK